MYLDTIRKVKLILILILLSANPVLSQTNARSVTSRPGAPTGNCKIFSSGFAEIYISFITGNIYTCRNPAGTATNSGTWTPIGGGGGTGDVTGPSASSDSELALFNGATGKVIKRSNALTGYVKVASGVVSAAAIPAADLPSLIDAAKLANGSVSNAEYQFLANVTSDIQTQLNAKQASDADLTIWAGVTPSANGQSLVAAANYAAMRALLDLEPGTDFLGFPTGTPTGSKFLRDDNSWQVPAGGGDMLLGTSQAVTAAKTFNEGTLILNGGDYGATDNSMPTGVEKAFFLNTNSSSRRLFVYNNGAFRALLQAGIDTVGAASGGTGDDTSATTGLPRIASGNWTYDAAASVGDTNTGTETNKAVTPDALAGSNFGTRTAQLVVFDFATDTATGDGKYYFVVPSELNGMNLVAVSAQVVNAGTTSTLNVDLARCAVVATGNMCSGTVVDILSTNLTIDSNENKSSTAAAAAVIDASNDDVATDQVIRVDVDAVHTTAAKGLIITLSFRLP